MLQYNISEAKAHFSELVNKAMTGEEVVIACDNKPLLKLVPVSPLVREERKSGSAKGRILYIAPDFDQTPADFGEYI